MECENDQELKILIAEENWGMSQIAKCLKQGRKRRIIFLKVINIPRSFTGIKGILFPN